MKNEDVCAEIESSLPLYAGGDLEPKAQAEVRAHLAVCAHCAERAHAALAARSALVSALRLRTSTGPDLWSGVRAVLRDEGILQPSHDDVLRPSAPHVVRAARSWRVWATAAAAIVLGFVVGLRLGHPDVDVDPTNGAPPIAKHVDVHPAFMPTAPGSSVVATVPVAASEGGLRRLAPGEIGLRDAAQSMYTDSYWIQNLGPEDRGAIAPASLQRVGRIR